MTDEQWAVFDKDLGDILLEAHYLQGALETKDPAMLLSAARDLRMYADDLVVKVLQALDKPNT